MQPSSMSVEQRSALLALALDSIPGDIYAAALAKACARLSVENPQRGMNILRNAWVELIPSLEIPLIKQPTGKVAASAVFLEAYFRHFGDWSAMEAELRKNSPAPPQFVDRLIDFISRGILSAATESGVAATAQQG